MKNCWLVVISIVIILAQSVDVLGKDKQMETFMDNARMQLLIEKLDKKFEGELGHWT